MDGADNIGLIVLTDAIAQSFKAPVQLAPKGNAVGYRRRLANGPQGRDVLGADLAVNAVTFRDADLQPDLQVRLYSAEADEHVMA
jgi:hypothetical protein